MVVCDLDGTLLNNEMKLSAENRFAIKQLAERNVYFVPATGRSISEMTDIAENQNIQYIICSNGAVVFDKKTQQSICMCMSQKNSKFVLDTVKLYDVYIIMHHNGKTYSAKLNTEIASKYHVNSTVYTLVQDCANIEGNLEELAYSMNSVESIVVFFANDDDKEKCIHKLCRNSNIHLAEVSKYSLEIFSVDAGKDKALMKLAKLLNLKMEEIISVGDSGNDIAMTKVSGLGLSTSNGSEKLKQVADKIICSNQEHVVQYIAEEYFDINQYVR